MSVFRSPAELMASGLDVLDRAAGLLRGLPQQKERFCPLFSGGHDSYCACYVASHHRLFGGTVYHIDTTISSRCTKVFVEQVCGDQGWKLRELRSSYTYEDVVRAYGFPGPAMHSMPYNRLKDRALRRLTRVGARRHSRRLLITGCRRQESVRRMGAVEDIKVGEWFPKGQCWTQTHRVWVAPCHDWSTGEQWSFMNHYRLDRNPVKESILGMSGECFCGAFARPYELEMIREVVPDVYREIRRLEGVALACGKPCKWGERPARKVEVLPTGPMCDGCDRKAAQAGIIVVDTTSGPPGSGGAPRARGQ